MSEKKKCTLVLRDTWDDWWKGTGIHAVSNAGKASDNFRSAIWFLIFVAGAVLTIQGLYLVLADYFEYPVTTMINLEKYDKVSRAFLRGLFFMKIE